MDTVFNTPRGLTYDPIYAEVWPVDGDGPVGRVEQPEKLEVTWEMTGSGTAVLEAPLTQTTGLLTSIDGKYLLVVGFNGLRHVSIPVEATVYAEDQAPNDVRVRIVTASPWSLLDGEIIPPAPRQWPINSVEQKTTEFFTAKGSADEVIRKIIRAGVEILGHPIVVLPDNPKGPNRSIAARLDKVSDLVKKALADTNLWVSLEPWLPGDPVLDGVSSSTPVVVADVRKYRRVDGLVWSTAGEDITSWKIKATRPTATHIFVHDDKKHPEQEIHSFTDGDSGRWIRRLAQGEYKPPEEEAKQVAEALLAEHAGTREIEVEVTPSSVWEFGSDNKHTHQYQVGDIVTLELPIGAFEQVITEVVVEYTPMALTVTPKVATPHNGE
ncbi:hypothetical protein GP475_08740 [Corynebacterium poyangense]|uniref:Gp28/Gp37-like domain-containing protein n=1 Tax=Corynebacterium poyangense TaxID=2684405 RepID=A0A7H0SQ88_9CORY|nr:hypothetical protein [Corynebacterium poyangense]QNQ90713.1 hypothetical protein GP475_08740 [Corynebacterium poyangense]